MKIYNIEEHLSCYCYDKEETPIAEVLRIERGDVKDITLVNNEIVFVMKGKINCTLRDNPSGELIKGQFTFLAAGDELRCRAKANTVLLILRMTEGMSLCYTFGIEQLCKGVECIERPEHLYALEANLRLQNFAEGLIDTWEDGLRCRVLLKAEVTRLLTMIRAYYPKDELCRLFFPILSMDTAFAEYVRTHYLKYRTVNELAKAINMTTQQFTRRFHNVFKQPPYEWIQREKARLIHKEICMSDKPFKEIATQFDFSVNANFIRFCRRAFNMTPGEIRRKGKEKRTCKVKQI